MATKSTAADTDTDAPLIDLNEALAGSGFKVFAEAIANGGRVKALCVPKGAEMSRAQIDQLTEFAKAPAGWPRKSPRCRTHRSIASSRNWPGSG